MKFKIPETYVLIVIMIFFASIASYIIPAGTYERVYSEDINVVSVVQGSYKVVEQTPISILEFLNSITIGLMDASDLIVFVLIIGGAFGIINATGTINSYAQSLLKDYQGKEKSIIFRIMLTFAIGGAIFGMSEETLPFYPLFILLALAMKFDKITGSAMVFIGSVSGFSAGVLNPFTTGVAQNIAGLPLFSGIVLRIVAFLIFFTTGYWYVYRHAMKTRKLGIVDTYDFCITDLAESVISKNNKRVVVVIVLSIIYLVYGINKFSFNLSEMAMVFLVMGIASGYVSNLKTGRIISEFMTGASNILYGAMVIGVARGVLVVLEKGQILDTLIYSMSNLIDSAAPAMNAIGMLLVQSVLNLFIASGSGQATVTMPIMVSIADLEGITRQSAVLAFQFGDGLTDLIIPTSGVLMAMLAISDIQWKDWLKWVLPLVVIWMVEGCTILGLSCIMGYGPF